MWKRNNTESWASRSAFSGTLWIVLRNTIGYVPAPCALTLDGLNISSETMKDLLRVNPEDWEQETEDMRQFFAKFGDRLPRPLREEHDKLARRFHRAVPA